MAYVYLHTRLDTNEIFYVGIGSDNKGKFARAYSKKRPAHRQNVINKAGYRVDVVYRDLTIEEAKLKEIKLIALYGRKDLGLGNLINKTDGGEGTLGMPCPNKGKKMKPMSEEAKSKLSKIAKNRDPLKHPFLGKKLTDEHKDKISRVGCKHSEESKDKISKATKGENNPMFGKSSWPICPVLQDLRKSKLSVSKKGKTSKKKGTKMTEEQLFNYRETLRINKENKNKI